MCAISKDSSRQRAFNLGQLRRLQVSEKVSRERTDNSGTAVVSCA